MHSKMILTIIFVTPRRRPFFGILTIISFYSLRRFLDLQHLLMSGVKLHREIVKGSVFTLLECGDRKDNFASVCRSGPHLHATVAYHIHKKKDFTGR